MKVPGADGTSIRVRRKWLLFGLVVTVLNYAFLLVVVFLLQIDPSVAVPVIVIASIVGGVAMMLFVLYVY